MENLKYLKSYDSFTENLLKEDAMIDEAFSPTELYAAASLGTLLLAFTYRVFGSEIDDFFEPIGSKILMTTQVVFAKFKNLLKIKLSDKQKNILDKHLHDVEVVKILKKALNDQEIKDKLLEIGKAKPGKQKKEKYIELEELLNLKLTASDKSKFGKIANSLEIKD